jgi:AI-2 transport protein TqsA
MERTHDRFAYLTAGVWVIAAVAIGFVLWVGRAILAPFALAVFIWLVMEGLARTIRRRTRVPRLLAHAFAIVLIIAGVVGFVSIMRGAVVEFATHSGDYERRINELIASVYAWLRLPDAPRLSQLLYSDASAQFIEPVLNSVSTLASNLVLILIYVGFLYASSNTFSAKLELLFPNIAGRRQARSVSKGIRRTMEEYLSVQTALSLITTLLTYATLLALGLDNALFWAVVIFILNYIPTIGSILATILPALFAIVQTDWPPWMPQDSLWAALAVFLGVSVWQFTIGNFLGPRMMGERLNLDALVVLLSLAVWGAIWGIPGMFLSAPLTVLIMIVLEQIDGARWISVILSADGKPVLPNPAVPAAAEQPAADIRSA